MKREEILNAAPEWLNEQALKCLGVEYTEDPEIVGNAIVGNVEPCWIKGLSGKMMIVKKGCNSDWNPAEDIRDAYQLEEKVKEMNLEAKYCDELDVLASLKEGNKRAYWNAVHATPEQRCKAFLLACLGEP